MTSKLYQTFVGSPARSSNYGLQLYTGDSLPDALASLAEAGPDLLVNREAYVTETSNGFRKIIARVDLDREVLARGSISAR